MSTPAERALAALYRDALAQMIRQDAAAEQEGRRILLTARTPAPGTPLIFSRAPKAAAALEDRLAREAAERPDA